MPSSLAWWISSRRAGSSFSERRYTIDLSRIDTLIQNQSDITLQEIIDTLQLKVSDETVRKAVLKLGYVYKKKSLHASEQERSRCEGETQKLGKEYVWVQSRKTGISG
ncbi:MAG: hypothetical protein J6L72_02775 [Butyricicoccus sp.]|nr:hypothetical protein [Butyricicoccus sp.]